MKKIIYLSTLLTVSLSGSLSAAIISTSANINVIAAPASIVEGAIESNTQITAFFETNAPVVAFPGPGPDLSGAVPGTATLLNSYYFSLDSVDPVGTTTTGGSVTFSPGEVIVAVYGNNANFNGNSYPQFQASGTTYNTTGNRGLEGPGELPSGLGGNVLTLSNLVISSNNIDQFRVITYVVPEPSRLLFTAFGLLALFQRRKRA